MDLGTGWNWDGETLTKANGFLFQLQSSSFLICFKTLLQVLYYLRELTLKLQMQAIDVVYAYRQVCSVISTLKGMRQEFTREFGKIFVETAKLGEDLHGEQFQLCKPRITSRQVHRSNPVTDSVEDYFRITLYDEFLSHVVAELQDRFLDNPGHDIALGLLHLLPSECVSLEMESDMPTELAIAADFYKDDLPHSLMLPMEYGMWIKKWKQCEKSSEIPNKLIDALKACNSLLFPNLLILLQLALTLPITSCESERSFSQLKLIKTSHRSTMSDHRLSGLALMKINRDRCENLGSADKIKELVKSFTELHPRRIKLPFVLAD